jgi:chitin-binding protein
LIDANNGNEWQANQAYNSGDIVTYEGKQYQARWWTRGETPTGSSVWKAL